MPNIPRMGPPADDLDIAARVMGTVQRQIESYQDALVTLRTMRRDMEQRRANPEAFPNRRVINTADGFADLLTENGIPRPLSLAMAAEEFGDAAMGADAWWTWDCCCTHCCITCQMATQVTECPETFIW